MSKEEKFFNALREFVLGPKVEGKGGFVELYKFKEQRYDEFEQALRRKIEQAFLEI